jgi:hypothetical protein
MTEGQSAWVVISIDHETTSSGPRGGYDDQVEEYYSYDSKVKNHKHIKKGDLVFVKGEKYLLGFGEIEKIDSKPGERENRKCPKCGKMPEERFKKIPKWRCSGKGCNYEFDDDELVIEKEKVTKYQASYRHAWQYADSPLEKREVLGYQLQVLQKRDSIRRLDPKKLPELIVRIMGSSALPSTNIHEIPELIMGGHELQLTKRRIGQQEFRLALLEKHGENCLISGAQPACVLEAAHIKKFAKYESHELNSGLLLRRDFHTLFDRHLIRINPNTWQTEVSPRIRHYESYKTLHLSEIRGDRERRPASEALLAHYELAASFF